MRKSEQGPLLVVRRSPRDRAKGILAAGPLRLPCAIGRSGTTIFKREGDGASPVAAMQLLAVCRRAGRLAALRPALPAKQIRDDSGWCDAPAHAAYNREVRLPFPASAERMAREDHLYDLVVVLDWNIRERRRGRGSAIFLHIAKPGYRPTEGCVAVSPKDMLRLQSFLRKGARLAVRR